MILARVLTALISILQAADLRNRAYLQAERIAQLDLALEDIARITASDTAPEQKSKLILAIVASSRDPKTHE